MATRNPVVRTIAKGVILIKWSGLLNGDQGAAFAVPQHTDKSVQVFGTFGAAGSVQMEGSNEQPAQQDNQSPTAPTWVLLHDATQTTSSAKTSASAYQLLENTAQIRPNVTAGDGTTNLTVEVTCVARRM